MRNSYALIATIVVTLVLPIVVAVSKRSRHQKSDSADVFALPPVMGCLMIFTGIFVMSAATWPGASGDISKFQFFLELSPIWCVAFATGIWFFRYKIIVNGDSVSVISIWRHQFTFADVNDLDIKCGSRGSRELIVYLKTGKKIRVSSLIQDFELLADTFSQNRITMNGLEQDSAEKLADRTRDVEGDKKALKLFAIGLIMIAIAAAISHAMKG